MTILLVTEVAYVTYEIITPYWENNSFICSFSSTSYFKMFFFHHRVVNSYVTSVTSVRKLDLASDTNDTLAAKRFLH